MCTMIHAHTRRQTRTHGHTTHTETYKATWIQTHTHGPNTHRGTHGYRHTFRHRHAYIGTDKINAIKINFKLAQLSWKKSRGLCGHSGAGYKC